RRRHTRFSRDWSSDMCSSDLTVRASLGTLSDATLVPSQGLLSKIVADGSTERGVYITDGSTATYVRVDVVGEHQGQAAVRGVEPGKKIIIQGQDLLSDGAAVKIAEREHQ